MCGKLEVLEQPVSHRDRFTSRSFISLSCHHSHLPAPLQSQSSPSLPFQPGHKQRRTCHIMVANPARLDSGGPPIQTPTHRYIPTTISHVESIAPLRWIPLTPIAPTHSLWSVFKTGYVIVLAKRIPPCVLVYYQFMYIYIYTLFPPCTAAEGAGVRELAPVGPPESGPGKAASNAVSCFSSSQPDASTAKPQATPR